MCTKAERRQTDQITSESRHNLPSIGSSTTTFRCSARSRLRHSSASDGVRDDLHADRSAAVASLRRQLTKVDAQEAAVRASRRSSCRCGMTSSGSSRARARQQLKEAQESSDVNAKWQTVTAQLQQIIDADQTDVKMKLKRPSGSSWSEGGRRRHW
jgi:hypothetical protein